MESDKSIVWNVTGEQVNIASEEAIINAVQNNGTNASELDGIIKGIMDNISGLRQEDAAQIVDAVEMAKEELEKNEPRVGRLRSCLALLASIVTSVKEIPTLTSYLQKLQKLINLYIHG